METLLGYAFLNLPKRIERIEANVLSTEHIYPFLGTLLEYIIEVPHDTQAADVRLKIRVRKTGRIVANMTHDEYKQKKNKAALEEWIKKAFQQADAVAKQSEEKLLVG